MTSTLRFIQLFQRSTMSKQPNWLIILGGASACLAVFSRTGFSDFSSIMFNLSLLAGLWGIYKYGKEVNSHILFRFIWIAILIQLFSWGLSQYITPEWAISTPKVKNMLSWFVFIPLAWLLVHKKNSIWIIWGCTALGIFLSPWITGGGLDEIIKGLNGQRVDFDLHNAQHTAFYFGTISIILCCMLKKIFNINKYLLILVIPLILYGLLVVYITQTRQSWLALIVTGLMISIYLTTKYIQKAPNKKRLIVISFFTISFVSLSFAILSSDKIVNRVMQEKESMKAIASLDFDNVPYSSFGIRLHSWIASIDFIKEKPILGWGSNGKTLVMKHTEWLPLSVRERFGHLHNFYLEMLVNYGLVGLLFYISIWILVGRMLLRKIKAGEIEKEFGYIFISTLCFWAVMNCFESYQNYPSGTFFFNVFMAGIVARIWQSIIKNVTNPLMKTECNLLK